MSTLLGLESFDWCANDQLERSLWRSGNNGLMLNQGRTRHGWGVPITTQPLTTTSGGGYATLTAGFAANIGIDFGNASLITFTSVASNTSISLNTAYGDGRIWVQASAFGSTVTPGSPSHFFYKVGEYYYWEMQVNETCIYVPPSGPIAEYSYVQYEYAIYINGESQDPGTPTPIFAGILNGPHVPYHLTSGQTAFTQATLQPGNGGVMDDVYITDTEFLGDISVVTLFPAANGSEDDFTPTPTQTNYLNVKEHNPGQDDDATYNTATASGQTDYYQMDTLVPFTPPVGSTGIKGVQAMVCERKTDAGLAITSGVWSCDSHPWGDFWPTQTYICQVQAARYFPGGSADFSQSDVNSIEVGMTRSA